MQSDSRGISGRASLRRDLDAAVERRATKLDALIGDLVRAGGLLGEEEPVQAVVADRLDRMGFALTRVEVDAADALADPLAGYPPLATAGRTSVVGRLRGTGDAETLHLSGHVDVVPVERPESWRYAPWAGEVAEGRVWGRGAGDMKGGLAAYLVGVEAALDAHDGPLPRDLVFSSVIEEECGGNGMRAVLREVGDGLPLLIGEPTALQAHVAGVGVVWFRLTALGSGAHAAVAGPAGPVDAILAAIGALRTLEARLNAGAEGSVFGTASPHPFNLNLGMLGGGSWPSSVPAEAELRGRLGFGVNVTPTEAQELIREAVAPVDGVAVTFDGFRARAYARTAEGPLGRALAGAHGTDAGGPLVPRVDTFTTDARQATGEALCYGPLAGAIHGTDEWVDLRSARHVARTIARLVADAVATDDNGA